MLIYAAISGHGYGHGSRSGAILLALAQRQPGWRLVLSTSLPAAFLRTVFGEVPFELRPCGWDVGVVQADALGADPAATLTALDELERRLPDQIAAEARWLRAQAGPVLLLGDVPPALARLAQAGGWPLIWVGNFGWDAIYSPMGGPFLAWAERCRLLYRQGQGLIHCPFSMSMNWGLPEIRVGLTVARTARAGRRPAPAAGVARAQPLRAGELRWAGLRAGGGALPPLARSGVREHRSLGRGGGPCAPVAPGTAPAGVHAAGGAIDHQARIQQLL